MPSALCADIGTTSLKAALIDERGKVLSYSRRRFLGSNPDFLAKEWLPALKSAMDEIFSDNDLKADSICISGNGPTLATCEGLTLLWNRQIPDIKGAPETVGKSLFLPRLTAFKKFYPDAWKGSKQIFSGPEFLIYSLTVTVRESDLLFMHGFDLFQKGKDPSDILFKDLTFAGGID